MSTSDRQVAVHLGDDALNRHSILLHVMSGTNDKGADGLDTGVEREVHHRHRFFADHGACIADDAHNLRGVMPKQGIDVFADRVLAGKVPIGERLADDDFIGRIQSLTKVKCTAAQERNAHCGEILWIGPKLSGTQSAALRQERVFDNSESPIAPISLAGSDRDKAYRIHAGQTAEACEQRVEKVGALGRRGIAGIGKAEMHGEHVLRDATHIGGAQPLVTFEQQAGADEQHHRQPDFDGQQPFAQRGSGAAAAHRA